MTALVFHNQWDWFTFATLIILLAVATWLTGCIRYLDREAHTDADERERWLSASRCRELRDGSGE